MCLYINRQATKQYKKRHGVRKYWKVVRVSPRGTLKSAIRKSYSWPQRSQWRYARGIVADIIVPNSICGGAIHVCLTKKSAVHLKEAYGNKSRFVIIPVYCHLKDLVAVGYDTICISNHKPTRAAFTKVFTRKEDLQRAIDKYRRSCR